MASKLAQYGVYIYLIHDESSALLKCAEASHQSFYYLGFTFTSYHATLLPIRLAHNSLRVIKNARSHSPQQQTRALIDKPPNRLLFASSSPTTFYFFNCYQSSLYIQFHPHSLTTTVVSNNGHLQDARRSCRPLQRRSLEHRVLFRGAVGCYVNAVPHFGHVCLGFATEVEH